MKYRTQPKIFEVEMSTTGICWISDPTVPEDGAFLCNKNILKFLCEPIEEEIDDITIYPQWDSTLTYGVPTTVMYQGQAVTATGLNNPPADLEDETQRNERLDKLMAPKGRT